MSVDGIREIEELNPPDNAITGLALPWPQRRPALGGAFA
jgi:hypothetical protein